MGTIVARTRQDASLGYTAQIRLKKTGRVCYSEARTFNDEESARRWVVQRERELSEPGAIDASKRDQEQARDIRQAEIADRQRYDRDRYLQYYYKISLTDFEAMWNSQGGKCDICSIDMLELGHDNRSVHVDHNHATGDVRALLCNACNNGIGKLKDSPRIARAAAAYLDRHGNYEHLWMEKKDSSEPALPMGS